MARCGEGVTVDLGEAIDGMIESAMSGANVSAVSSADSPAACAAAGGVVRRPGPYATPEQRRRGFVCALPASGLFGSPNLGNLQQSAKSVFQTVSSNPLAFFAGAIGAPVAMGFVSRLLSRGAIVGIRIDPLATRGVAFGATALSALVWGYPSLWGATIGQAVPTLDMLAAYIVEKLVPGTPMVPTGGLAPSTPEGSVSGLPHLAATEEDIVDLQRLKDELAGVRGSVSHVSGVRTPPQPSMSGRNGSVSVNGAASNSVPRKFH